MQKFKQYKRTAIAEMRPVTAEDIKEYEETGVIVVNETSVSISQADKKNGSPKEGDQIARNPKDHTDVWLVAKKYFSENFEPVEESLNESANLVRHAYENELDSEYGAGIVRRYGKKN